MIVSVEGRNVVRVANEQVNSKIRHDQTRRPFSRNFASITHSLASRPWGFAT